MVDILPNFATTVLASPDKPCVSEGSWRLSFREVDILSDNLCYELAQASASISDDVCFLGGAGAQRLIFLLACIKAGYCFCSPILQMGESYTVQFAHLIQPKVLMFEQGFEDLAEKMAAKATIPFTTDTVDHGRPATRDLPLEAPSFISFTSGSTCLPKGMRRNRASLANFIRHGIKLQNLTQDDTVALLGNLWPLRSLRDLPRGPVLFAMTPPDWAAQVWLNG